MGREVFEADGKKAKPGDGTSKRWAARIRNMEEELFPDALQILDLYHLADNIYPFGKYLFEGDSSRYTPWAIHYYTHIVLFVYQFAHSFIIQFSLSAANANRGTGGVWKAALQSSYLQHRG